jgi:predicted DNA-binding protein with PD1-like motif
MKALFICHSITEFSNEKEIQFNVFDHTGTVHQGTIKLETDKSVNEFKVDEQYEVIFKFKNHDRR